VGQLEMFGQRRDVEVLRSSGGTVQESVAVRAADVFLTAAQVITRYGWGRTKGYRVLRSAGFPRPIAGDRYRLDTLIAWEDAQVASPQQPRAVRALPPRKRATSRSV
jgi:predicted DNA-binding transcriptional regulator AlpA